MKVKEIIGFWKDERYYAYYTTIIENKNVILGRCLRSALRTRGYQFKRMLEDSINDIVDFR